MGFWDNNSGSQSGNFWTNNTPAPQPIQKKGGFGSQLEQALLAFSHGFGHQAPQQPIQAPPAMLQRPASAHVPNANLVGMSRGYLNTIGGLAAPIVTGLGEAASHDVIAPIMATGQSIGNMATGHKADWKKNYNHATDAYTNQVYNDVQGIDNKLGTSINQQMTDAYAHPGKTAAFSTLAAIGGGLGDMGKAGTVIGRGMGLGFGGYQLAQTPQLVKEYNAAKTPEEKSRILTEGVLNTGMGVLGAAHGAPLAKDGVVAAGKGAKYVANDPVLRNQNGFIAGSGAKDFAKNQAKGKTFIDPADNLPKFEVSDHKASVRNSGLKELNNKGETTLGNLINHKELFKQYGKNNDTFDARNVRVTADSNLPPSRHGQYDPATNTITLNPELLRTKDDILNSLVHENQHGVDVHEGVFGGTNPEQAGGFDNYLKNIGEQRATDQANRRTMTPQERAANPSIAQAGPDPAQALGYLQRDKVAQAIQDTGALTASHPSVGAEKPSHIMANETAHTGDQTISKADMQTIIDTHRKRFNDSKVSFPAADKNSAVLGDYNFHDDMIRIANNEPNALETYNHESIHKAVGQFLSDKEITQLYKDIVRVQGGKSALIKKYSEIGYKNVSWQKAAEEELANHFAEIHQQGLKVMGKPDGATQLAKWASDKGLPMSLVRTILKLSATIEKHFGSGAASAGRLQAFYDKVEAGDFHGATRRTEQHLKPDTLTRKASNATVNALMKVNTPIQSVNTAAMKLAEKTAEHQYGSGASDTLRITATKPTLPEVPKKEDVKTTVGGAADMSSKGLNPDEAPNRFDRRVAADPRANDALKASMNANGTHTVLHNDPVIASAKARIAANEDAALSYAKRTDSTEANATAMELLSKYLDEGKFEAADELTRAISPRFTKNGQEMQILAAYARMTPAGAIKYATRQLEKAAIDKVGSRRIETVTSKAKTAIDKAHDESAVQVAKELAKTPEERLAGRINQHGGKLPKHDPITDMVNTLHKVAQQVLPEKGKSVPRDPMAFIGDAIRNKEEYTRVWSEAKKLVEAKYKDDPEALAELDSYFNSQLSRPYAKSQLDKAVQNGLKGIDMANLVRQHFTEVDATAKNLADKLVSQAGLDVSSAKQLAADITARFNEVATARKESVLKQMFKEKGVTAHKSQVDRLIEMSNLGGFDKEALHPLIAEKMGLPTMNPEIAKNIKTLAEKVQALPKDSAERAYAASDLMSYIAEQIPQSKLANMVSVWKAGMLSGVKTTGGNLESNAVFGGLKKIADAPASLADALMSIGTHKRTKTFTMRGISSGTTEGVKEAGHTIMTGKDKRDVLVGSDKYEQHAEINFNAGNKIWEKAAQTVLGKPANVMFRLMKAGDQPFHYAALKNSLYDQAYAAAKNQKLSGSEKKAFVTDFVKNPPATAAETALREATKSTLAHDTLTGKIIPAIKNSIDQQDWAPKPMREGAKAVIDGLVPFSKIPLGFASRTVDFTPLGIGREMMFQAARHEFDQRAMSQAIGEGLTGLGAIYLGMQLAQHGNLSGGFPKGDAKEQERWKAEHITPNSIKINGQWHSLNYLGPLGLLFNIGSTMNQAQRNGDDWKGQALAGAGGFGQGLLAQSFVQGLSAFSDAINNPTQNFKSYMRSEIGSLIPGWSADLANATDHWQRQQDGLLDGAKARIAGSMGRGSMPIKKDTFGNKLEQAAGGLNAAFNPLKPSNARSTPVTNEIDRLKATSKDNFVIPTPDKTIDVGGQTIRMTQQQQDQYNSAIGQQVQDLWGQIIKTSDYKDLSDNNKANTLRNAMQDIQAVEKQKMLANMGQTALSENVKLTQQQKYLASGDITPEDYVYQAVKSAQAKELRDAGISTAGGNKRIGSAYKKVSTKKVAKGRKIAVKKVTFKKPPAIKKAPAVKKAKVSQVKAHSLAPNTKLMAALLKTKA